MGGMGHYGGFPGGFFPGGLSWCIVFITGNEKETLVIPFLASKQWEQWLNSSMMVILVMIYVREKRASYKLIYLATPWWLQSWYYHPQEGASLQVSGEC